jgi:methionyl-tRNA formyltransferase
MLTRFAFFGYDAMLPAVEAALARGHILAAVFTFVGEPDSSAALRALAAGRGVPLSTAPPTRADVDALEASGIDALVVAGYPWRVPVPRAVPAANYHPSLLPAGRGIMPMAGIILDAPEAAGATLHVLEAAFDTGPVIARVPLPLAPGQDVDTLAARVALAAPGPICTFLDDPAGAVARAVPQDEARASRFPLPDAAMRRLDWAEPHDRCAARVRAFGRFGAIAPVGGRDYIARAAASWPADHGLPPGALALADGGDMVVAAAGGLVHLKGPEPLEGGQPLR